MISKVLSFIHPQLIATISIIFLWEVWLLKGRTIATRVLSKRMILFVIRRIVLQAIMFFSFAITAIVHISSY
jgi:hypothetical protein